jgi:hypothetical protein
MAFDAVGGADRATRRGDGPPVRGAGLRRACDGARVAQPGTMIFKGATVRGFWLSDWLMARSFPQQLLMARSVTQALARAGSPKAGLPACLRPRRGREALEAYTSAMSAGKVLISSRRPSRLGCRPTTDRAGGAARDGGLEHADQRRGDSSAAGRWRRRWSRGALRDGTYEADEANAAERCVREGFRVLELGAGIGYVTAICARRTAPENVLAVEANPALIPVIESNACAQRRAGCDGPARRGRGPRGGRRRPAPFACRIISPPRASRAEGGRASRFR